MNPITPSSVGSGIAHTGETTTNSYCFTGTNNTGGGAAMALMQPWIAVPVYVVAA
jgi:hypothetical protein